MTDEKKPTTKQIGQKNYAKVVAHKNKHPWATQSEASQDIKLSLATVNRHGKKARGEYLKEREQRKGAK